MLPNYFFALRNWISCNLCLCVLSPIFLISILVLLATQDLSDFSSQGQNVMQYLCLLLISGGSTLATKPIRSVEDPVKDSS
ncbi:hypothetical protein SLE2022_397810 [Rubroshorea leprosula]